MKKLFLDDARESYDDTWDLVTSSQEFKKYIEDMFKEEKRIPDIISFDHDLHTEHYMKTPFGDEEAYNKMYKNFIHETGLDCAKWICNFCLEEGLALPEIHIHSGNPVGAKNIAYAIMNASLFYFEEELIIQPRYYALGDPVRQ